MNSHSLIAGAIAAGGMGIALYDYLKSRGYNSDEISKLISSNPISAKEYLAQSAPDVKSVTNKRSLNKLKKVLREEHNPIVSSILGAQFEHAMNSGENAFVYKGKNDYYVISPKNVNQLVLEHELGHVKDFRGLEAQNKDPHEHYGGKSFLRGYGQQLFKSIYDKDIIRREQNAWDHVQTKGPERDKIQELALNSYHKAFHKGRGAVAGFIGGSTAAELLANKLSPNMSPLKNEAFSITGGIIGALPALLS